jgi:hypothetical protein
MDFTSHIICFEIIAKFDTPLNSAHKNPQIQVGWKSEENIKFGSKKLGGTVGKETYLFRLRTFGHPYERATQNRQKKIELWIKALKSTVSRAAKNSGIANKATQIGGQPGTKRF